MNRVAQVRKHHRDAPMMVRSKGTKPKGSVQP